MGRNNADFNIERAADRIKEARAAGADVKYSDGGKTVTKVYPPIEHKDTK